MSLPTISVGPPPPSQQQGEIKNAEFLLSHIGDLFCHMVKQELQAINININEDKKIVWNKVDQREVKKCSVCNVILFNFHWTCDTCGFAVCINCYKGRMSGLCKVYGEPGTDRDDFSWLLCTNRQGHEQESLMLTQILAGDALSALDKSMHEARAKWNIVSECGCPVSKEAEETSGQNIFLQEKPNCEVKENKDGANRSDSPLSWLADVSLSNEDMNANKYSNSSDSDDSTMEDDNDSTLRELLIRSSHKPGGSRSGSTSPSSASTSAPILNYYIRKTTYTGNCTYIKQLPIQTMIKSISKNKYPDTPHEWFCNGKLLVLLDPSSPNNYKIFQDQWIRGQPVMVLNISNKLQKDRCIREYFSRNFGNVEVTMVDVVSGNTVADLMKSLPLGEYTQRTGKLNMASRLPKCMVQPDLGPKLKNSLGSFLHPNNATTSLCVNVVDIVDTMVYTNTHVDNEEILQYFAMNDECKEIDRIMLRRVEEEGIMPSALWHIYSARDADCIRDMLNVVTRERGLKPQGDPILSQSWYLSKALRDRLYREYNIRVYTVIQCIGDAIFIPAGAPHQVLNLMNNARVAVKFVTAENISQSLYQQEEFRSICDHKDNIEIKSILYHNIKNSLAVLSAQT